VLNPSFPVCPIVMHVQKHDIKREYVLSNLALAIPRIPDACLGRFSCATWLAKYRIYGIDGVSIYGG
jgi:hypothetical protein